MRDVDRFVDTLYAPALQNLNIQSFITPWHRYVVDPNRTPDEYDADAVEGAKHPAGTHPKGLHWNVTTQGEPLIVSPMSPELHNTLVKKYYQPFHDLIQDMRQKLKAKHPHVFHLDLHSMPSQGTRFHPDPGEKRAEVVISDQHGTSAAPDFKDEVLDAFQQAGFQVAYNWPYIGGGITKTYGEPESGFHTVQIELNRAQYMDEDSKQLNTENLSAIQKKLETALSAIQSGLQKRLNG